MRSLPIRIRLTLWYFAMFASAAALLCLVSLWMLQRSVDETEYHDLQERADDVQSVLSHEPPGQSLRELANDLASIYEDKDDGKYLQVRDDKGNWIFRSKRMIQENPELPAPDQLSNAGKMTEFPQGTRYVRVLAFPIVVRGEHYSVQTGLALNKSMVLLANFRMKLLLIAPIVILLATAGGHAMSRKALAPVAALAAEARRINDRNLDIRLPVPNAQDEISELSLTLNQMLERIDRAFASVRSFTGNASHELRTPIALLRTEIEVALYRPRNGEEYRATLLRLHEESLRLTSLMDNLLSLARADGGADAISFVPVHVNVVLLETLKAWQSEMDRAMLDFHVETLAEDAIVLCDSNGIQRLLSVLLENASKYTPPGRSVKLNAAVESACIVFSVLDTGIGIAPEDRVRIFDRFYRAPSRNEYPVEGSGLGLAIAKWIAERHGTNLSVESELGRGSCFSFSLGRSDLPAPDIRPGSLLSASLAKRLKVPTFRSL